jgi:hypothetical protein
MWKGYEKERIMKSIDTSDTTSEDSIDTSDWIDTSDGLCEVFRLVTTTAEPLPVDVLAKGALELASKRAIDAATINGELRLELLASAISRTVPEALARAGLVREARAGDDWIETLLDVARARMTVSNRVRKDDK